MRLFCLILFFFLRLACYTQTSTVTPIVWQIALNTSKEECYKGAAVIQVANATPSTTIIWSNGITNLNSIGDLSAGNYSVKVKEGNQDTTLYFSIVKEECKVLISNQFTPNGDGYNDKWQIAFVNNYPNMEVIVFNKWGQQVHRQIGDYSPWDGTHLGINVPDGAYYYVFYYDKNKQSNYLKGSITLLR
jgi:large repetitive protein